MNYRKVILIACVGTMVIFGGCKKEANLESKPIKTSGVVNSVTPTGEAKQPVATEKPNVSGSPIANGAVSTTVPTASVETKATLSGVGFSLDSASFAKYEEQVEFERTIKAFGLAIEKGDYKEAIKYCDTSLSEYIKNLYTGKGVIADPFSRAIIEKLPLKFISAKAFYYNGTPYPDFNITKNNPTVNFDVTFEYTDKDGKKYEAGGITTGVKGTDGKIKLVGLGGTL